MKAFREPILNGIDFIAGALDIRPSGLVLAAAPAPSLRDVLRDLVRRARDPANRRTALSTLWVLSVLVLSVASGLGIWVLHLFTGSFSAGILIAVATWSFFFGICTLFFLPQKFIATIFGSLLGAGASDLSSGAGLITKAHTSVKDMADQIVLIFKGTDGPSPTFIAWCVWAFVIVYLLVCLPAFFRDEK